MFSSGGLSPINSSFANCQDFSCWNEERKEVEEEDVDIFEQAAIHQSQSPTTPAAETATSGQATQNGGVYSPTDAEIKEVIRGSRIEWTPDFLRLLRGGSNKELPDCFDDTPIKSKPSLKAISSVKSDYQKFIQDFSGIYNELLIHMEFTDEQLLAYSASEREDLLTLINVFIANACHVEPDNYDPGYEDLMTLLHQRFALQEEFVDYFPQYEDTKH
jgi:hypothetical protein